MNSIQDNFKILAKIILIISDIMSEKNVSYSLTSEIDGFDKNFEAKTNNFSWLALLFMHHINPEEIYFTYDEWVYVKATRGMDTHIMLEVAPDSNFEEGFFESLKDAPILYDEIWLRWNNEKYENLIKWIAE